MSPARVDILRSCPDCGGQYIGFKGLCRNRFTEQIALEEPAAALHQEGLMTQRFHTLRNHREMQVVTQVYDHARDGRIIAVGQDVAHKGLVGLQLVHRQAFEVAKGRITSTKITQTEAHTQGLQLLHLGDDVFDIEHK